MWGYYRRVLGRAVQMTRADFGLAGARPSVVKVLVFIVGLLVLWGLGAADALSSRIGDFWAGVITFAIVVPAVFAANVLTAPPALQREADETIRRLGKALDDKEARQAAINSLWELRKRGVEIRNERFTDEALFPLWQERFTAWRKEVLDAAERVNVNLRHNLDVLDRIDATRLPIIPAVNRQHTLDARVLSEILRRLAEFLERQI